MKVGGSTLTDVTAEAVTRDMHFPKYLGNMNDYEETWGLRKLIISHARKSAHTRKLEEVPVTDPTGLEYRNALQPMGILKHTACELLQIEMEIQILYHVAVKWLLGQVIKRCCEISYSCMPRYIPRIRAVGKHAMIAVDFLP